MNIADKAKVAPTIHHGYVNCLFAERAYLARLEKTYTKKKETIDDEYGKDDRPRLVRERELTRREDMIKLKESIMIQKELVRYLEDTCKIMANYGFAIRDSISIMNMM